MSKDTMEGLTKAIEAIKKEIEELEQHKKVMTSVSGRQLTESAKKLDSLNIQEIYKLKENLYKIYPDIFIKESNTTLWNNEAKASDTIKKQIKNAVNVLEANIEALEKLTEFENTFNIGNPVFYKSDVGLINRIFIYDSFTMDIIKFEDNQEAKNGDIIITLIFVINSIGTHTKNVLAKDILPYNESTKLLYERNKTK